MKKLLLGALLIFLIPLMVWANNIIFYSPGTASLTTTPSQILTSNSLRKYLILVNTGSNTVIIKTGAAPASSTDGIPIPAGGNWEPFQAPGNSIYGRAVTGTSTIEYQQGN